MPVAIQCEPVDEFTIFRVAGRDGIFFWSLIEGLQIKATVWSIFIIGNLHLESREDFCQTTIVLDGRYSLIPLGRMAGVFRQGFLAPPGPLRRSSESPVHDSDR